MLDNVLNQSDTSKKGTGKSNRALNSSLTYRIYNLTLPQKRNYVLTSVAWVLVVGYLLGAIVMALTQVQTIKPALNLNLQLVEFKL